jgi:hypothetical protein
MRYWWVNQNQTFRHEVEGGYLWSPKRQADNSRSHFYETMREVAPGDVVFSFSDTRLAAIGIARSYVYTSSKPDAFGNIGMNWSQLGWQVKVDYRKLQNAIRPKDFMQLIGPTLPAKYSPLQANGNGNQGVYLTEIPVGMANVLIDLIGPEAKQVVYSGAELAAEAAVPYGKSIEPEEEAVEMYEELQVKQIVRDNTLQETVRDALVKARLGQGQFRKSVSTLETTCRITKVTNPIHLVASHIKPWRESNNGERLDAENGLLLTPSIDHLFDRGFITFSGGGMLICSPVADNVSLKKMGVPVDQQFSVGSFTKLQQGYLEFHRDKVFKRIASP